MNIASFRVVSDYFITETASLADLILPSSFPIESGGTFTNTQKYILSFQPGIKQGIEKNTCEQLIGIMSAVGNKVNYKSIEEVTAALASELQNINTKTSDRKYNFILTDNDNNYRNYEHGCDYLVKSFESDFQLAFRNIQ